MLQDSLDDVWVEDDADDPNPGATFLTDKRINLARGDTVLIIFFYASES
jgi:hypothetical protein